MAEGGGGLSLEKRRLRDGLTLHNSLTGGWSQVGVWLCSQGTSNRTRGKGLRLCHGRSRSDIWENFPKSAVQPRHRLPRAVLESPPLKGFKSCIEAALGDLV